MIRYKHIAKIFDSADHIVFLFMFSFRSSTWLGSVKLINVRFAEKLIAFVSKNLLRFFPQNIDCARIKLFAAQPFCMRSPNLLLRTETPCRGWQLGFFVGNQEFF